MRTACSRHEGNLYVHLQAAAMFDRHDLLDEGAREHEMARRLQPDPAAAPAATPVDLNGLQQFLGDVDRLLRAIDGPTRGPTVAPSTQRGN
ncbi:MAG TPA: hypothetical protein VFZ65_13425 [Planctomycetota bacterium]|nr:hypothetical protein [Planctomycetota bacterium]